MLLLYKDPKGETIGSTTKAHSVTGNHVSQIQRSNSKSDWEEKVATLEKTLRERDAKIATLMRNGNEKVIISFVTHNYYKLLLCTVVFLFRNQKQMLEKDTHKQLLSRVM